MTDAQQDWYAEFARPVFRKRIPEMVDEATPELAARLMDSPTAYLGLISVLDVAVTESEELLREAVVTARHAGLNWEQIGGALGLDRQAAQLRFAPQVESSELVTVEQAPPPAATAPPTVSQVIGAAIADALGNPGDPRENPATFVPGTRRRIYVTTGEKQVMRRYGPYGWHLVDYDAYYHTLELDNQQWEHERTNFRRRPDGPGWRHVGDGWGWWGYWKRPTGLPVLPGKPHPKEFE